MSRHVVLSLYKQLLREGGTLKLTSPEFYMMRVRDEFRRNKDLRSKSDINKAIQVFTY